MVHYIPMFKWIYNERAFNDIERSNQALKHSFLYTLVNWARVFIEDHTLSMIDFMEWLYV